MRSEWGQSYYPTGTDVVSCGIKWTKVIAAPRHLSNGSEAQESSAESVQGDDG